MENIMKTQNTYISKIATIVYTNFTENVDMNNKLFSQLELNNLINTDKDIIRVDYYRNEKLVKSVKKGDTVMIFTASVDTREFTGCAFMLNNEESPENSTKIKLMFTEDERANKWQSIKYNNKGDYFMRYGDRVYIDWLTLNNHEIR